MGVVALLALLALLLPRTGILRIGVRSIRHVPLIDDLPLSSENGLVTTQRGFPSPIASISQGQFSKGEGYSRPALPSLLLMFA